MPGDFVSGRELCTANTFSAIKKELDGLIIYARNALADFVLIGKFLLRIMN